VARVADGHPAKSFTRGDVGARLEAQDIDVKIPRHVLVEAVDGD
jgi:hypothetical protein